MFILRLPLLKILNKHVLLGSIGFIKAKKSGFGKLGLGYLFLIKLILRFSKSNS